VKLKCQSITKILAVCIKYPMRDLLFTSITMPDPQTSGKWCQRSLCLASARFSKLWIPCVHHLL